MGIGVELKVVAKDIRRLFSIGPGHLKQLAWKNAIAAEK
jgi:hypothetical protein